MKSLPKSLLQSLPGLSMMSVIASVFFTVFSHNTFAQSRDSIGHHYDSLANVKLQTLDSSTNRINNKVDSIQLRANNLLNPNFNTLTSRLRSKKLAPTDTVHAARELDSLKTGLRSKIDSLNHLNLPTKQYTLQLDSLNKLSPQKYIDHANKKIHSAESRINQPINTIENKINDKLNTIRQESGNNTNLPENISTKNLGVDDINVGNINARKISSPEIDTPNINNPISNQTTPVTELSDKLTDIKTIPQQQVDNIKSLDEIKTAQDNLSDINQTTDKIQSYSDDVKNISEKNIDDVKSIPEAIENKAGKLDEVQELGKQTAEIDKAKGMIEKTKDPEAIKQMAQQQITKQAVDHFKGKEQALKAAMDKVSKLKQKYPEVSSLKDLPKRPPNPMKGKPLIERFVPGLTLQLQKISHVMIDLNPVISYRFSGRINAGLGWNERLSFVKWNKLSTPERIYGPRVFGGFNFKKGFSAKAELEKMNTLIPQSPISPDGSRQWVWSAFVGIRKDYKFIGTVRGNVQVLYNIYDDHNNSPYPDRLNVRMGFDFPMKKPQKTRK